MASTLQELPLIWINSLDGRRPESPKVRTIIRRQVMSNAHAQRKRQGEYKKVNLRQYRLRPVAVAHDKPEAVTVELGDAVADSDPCPDNKSIPERTVTKRGQQPERVRSSLCRIGKSTILPCIPASPSSTGYEAMRIRYNFDVIDLSALTALHVGRTTAQLLQDRPARLLEILRCKQWSYFSYIPWRFGHTQCLDDAICCVAARVHQWLTAPGIPNDRVLALYSRAVRSLQAALDNPAERMQADVLCATEVLSIYQLLDTERWESWTLHAAGSASLLRLRGPERYKTNFEKALFLAQVGPIITEATFNASPCFLEEPAWQRLFQTIFLGKSIFSTYSDVFIKMWTCISTLPRLTRDTRSVICKDEAIPQESQDQLQDRLFDLRSRLMTLATEENLATTVSYGQVECSRLLIEQAMSEQQHDILGLLGINLIRLERLIVALGTTKAPSMERHVQDLAAMLLQIEAAAVAVNPRASLSLTYKVMLAKAAAITAEEWRSAILSRPPHSAMSQKVFDGWIGLTCPWRVSREFASRQRQREYPPSRSRLAGICQDGSSQELCGCCGRRPPIDHMNH